MNYSNPELVEALAQRYVLGTMSYRARRRFSQLVEENSELRDRVLDWEERLTPMLLSLPPVKPSELVWRRIHREITRESNTVGPNRAPASVQSFSSLQVAIMAMLAVTIGFTSLGWWQASNQPTETIVQHRIVNQPDAASVSILANAESTFWVARIYPKAARLDIVVQTRPKAAVDSDYQLWTIQDDGKPVSLGLLPKSGNRSLPLDERLLAAISRSQMLAVSLEPLGGSPDEVPSGPVLFSGELFLPQG